MLKKAIALWKQERKHKGTTLHRRLLIFFISVSVVLILLFTLLLSIFGIDGKQEHSVQAQLTTQLSMLADSVEVSHWTVSALPRIWRHGVTVSFPITVSLPTGCRSIPN